MNVNEGGSVNFPISFTGSTAVNCHFEPIEPSITFMGTIDENSKVITAMDPLPFTSSNNPIIEIFAGEDANCQNDRFTFNLVCKIFTNGQNFPQSCPSIVVNVIDNDDAGACQDPHLKQKVRGVDEDGNVVVKNICYDLYGNAGDQFELITDNVLKTSLMFELRDDYYIGKAFYKTKLGFFNVTTSSLKTDQRFYETLNPNVFLVGNKENYPHANIEIAPSSKKIAYVEENRLQAIKVNKIDQGFGKSYLNVMVEKSESLDGVFDKHHGGLFGEIANQEYEFYESVQDTDATVVKINGRFVKAFLKNSLGQDCYSMSLEEIIFPKNAYSFQKSL